VLGTVARGDKTAGSVSRLSDTRSPPVTRRNCAPGGTTRSSYSRSSGLSINPLLRVSKPHRRHPDFAERRQHPVLAEMHAWPKGVSDVCADAGGPAVCADPAVTPMFPRRSDAQRLRPGRPACPDGPGRNSSAANARIEVPHRSRAAHLRRWGQADVIQRAR
jgi:hypothetical protein